ncbi:shikimate dehydrogenase [Hoyosella sp. YIM 151337]|uniref:shikimate dehydrogenase n=1 Tax=Hoyosella sp. YIM 151337 TaxID=2992742 RepID=UPI002236221C|nr:shikimate dehydrogenase [Hoyosella sp. YIM 151337]MCW4353226.1 shikimate dehydrogenase [Hoyosella sp. YIM 151337]
MADRGPARKAGVLGSPISHSRSPQLHLAAYRALGLTDWTYERIECRAGELAGIVSHLGPEWVGVSVTMPGKLEALEFASERTVRAVAVGSANTLVRTDTGWRADCTDVDGVTGALADLGLTDLSSGPAVVIGAGGTARPALVALAELGARGVSVVARDEGRAQGALGCGAAAGLEISYAPFAAIAELAQEASVLISTVPADALGEHIEAAAHASRVLDVIYHPWPTPLATAVEQRGGAVVGGLSMLLNQAFGQVEQFTEMPAPRAEMAAALNHAMQ